MQTIKVNTAGNWRLYTNTVPDTMTVLGTVTRNEIETGALCQVRSTGAYVSLQAGAIRTLPQREVRAALEGK